MPEQVLFREAPQRGKWILSAKDLLSAYAITFPTSVLLGLLAGYQVYSNAAGTKPLFDTFAIQFVRYLIYGLLAPFLVVLAIRYPIPDTRRSTSRNIAALIGFFPVYSVVYSLVRLLVLPAYDRFRNQWLTRDPVLLWSLIKSNIVEQIIIYVLLVSIGEVIGFYVRERQREGDRPPLAPCEAIYAPCAKAALSEPDFLSQ